MVSSSSSGNTLDNDGPPNKKPRKRGITKMKPVTRMKDSGKKYPIQWNSKNQPIGPNRAKLSSYIGHCTRNRVSISCSSWKLVSDDIKNMIVEQVMVMYNLVQSHTFLF